MRDVILHAFNWQYQEIIARVVRKLGLNSALGV
jgi:hypothetical protein